MQQTVERVKMQTSPAANECLTHSSRKSCVRRPQNVASVDTVHHYQSA